MGKLEDLDITGLIKQRYGAPLGDAHELFVRAILMRLGFEVGKIDTSGSPFDIIIIAFKKPNGEKLMLRAQVKTIESSLHLIAGVRGGIDREYKSNVKVYKYTESHTDLILGVDKFTLDIYVVPARFTSIWGKSVSKNKIKALKNNWEILLNWNDEYLNELKKELMASLK